MLSQQATRNELCGVNLLELSLFTTMHSFLLLFGLSAFVSFTDAYITPKTMRSSAAIVQFSGSTTSNSQRLVPQWPLLRMDLRSNNSDDKTNDSIATSQQPDLISSKSDITQQLTVVGSFAALAIGTFVCVQLWYGAGQSLVGTEYFQFICQRIFPIAFGVIFSAVGVGHFVFVDNFARIVPPKGTWGGLWQLPAPFSEQLGIPYADYQSYASGILEFIGGLWLLAGGLGFTDPSLPGFFLFFLTIAVSPANLYMFTHDVGPGGSAPPLSYPWGHLARFVLQCGLLSNFWIMSHPPAL